ncbi:hypothetical protein LTR36_001921 [Oleoguttula mirabilis]|uniref:Serine/threonine-protein phosphatase 4 regulatory subunit 3-like central domain-containing protein n=1 Tax=Oleoguttula mirabilis TaxID=1507867 RepID=A0AAV9JN55_9PEZI|nr:hypothetical protein LTR36_001921 [Oleoguttula mirabilis]
MQERKRVKVYELKNNDWYDRGTGFCFGQIVNSPQSTPESPDARILVVSEEDTSRVLLETRITKDDGYQKQQDTLIVWTESNGTDMALSFQEAEGCSQTWEFVHDIQQKISALAPDDALSDDLLDPAHPVTLPEPQLGRLDEVENAIRVASATGPGRDALGKFIMSAEQMYILKLGPLVTQAEEEESVPDLHRLCTIMKHLILLNDSAIIEFAVTDEAIMGVVGALEYDPDFPSHRANHRQYLSDSSKFKEVVKIDRPEIRRKIHLTYRLLYLKDVVLARILDDPTFSVLNSLIFFHQVDIVNHFQQNAEFLKELFGIFEGDETLRKKDAVLFIQNCCAVTKNIQAQSRAQLYSNFIQHGLFRVITFALRHHEAQVRVAGTDILVALIDHDPHMVRNHIFTAIKEKGTPLTDTLIELLLVEVDLGVKSQMADAIKILLDPGNTNGMDMMARQANSEAMAKRGLLNGQHTHAAPQTEAFIQSFYDDSAKRLFQPLKDLEHRTNMQNLSVHETSLFTHLVEVLCFFVRQHSYRSKLFILSENLHARVAQLLSCPQKYMKLTALKWFRTCIGLQDEFHNRQLIQNRLLEPILNIVYETMPKDNLLNSACLELFEYIKREGIKQLIVHLVEQYRERLMGISYVNTFQALVLKYDQLAGGYLASTANGATDDSSFTTQEGTPTQSHRMSNNGRQAFTGLREMDGDEAAYFEHDDDGDEDEEGGLPTSASAAAKGSLHAAGVPNGASPVRPLVNYPTDEEEDEGMEHEMLASSPDRHEAQAAVAGRLDGKIRGSSSSAADPASDEPTDAPVDPMDTEPTADERSTSPPQPERRGRDRRPVPVEGSPGQQPAGPPDSPPEPLAMKRRREEEDDDELGKLMGGQQSKRRNSSVRKLDLERDRERERERGVPGTGLDGAADVAAAGSVAITAAPVNDIGAQSAPVVAHGHTLRRKGSLKTRNETQGRFAIKAVATPSAAAVAKGQLEAHENGNGNGNANGSANGGGGGGGDG